MRSFLKIFFASFTCPDRFCDHLLFFYRRLCEQHRISGIGKSQGEEIGSNAVLVLGSERVLSVKSPEPIHSPDSAIPVIIRPVYYDVIRMIRYAKTDSAVKGIYIKAGSNGNGLGTTEEIRNALIDFKKSGKFIFAFGDVISLKAYYAANIADKIYCNPKGGVEWKGLTSIMGFLKGSLDKLEIQPEIFYAGKFKSATEPLRAEKMSDANRLQLTELLGDIFNHILDQTAAARGQDSCGFAPLCG